MTLQHLNTWLFWGFWLPASGLVVFGPLPAQISIHSTKKKQNLQAWIGQNGIEDIFNAFQVFVPVISGTCIFHLPIETQQKAKNTCLSRLAPDLLHYWASNLASSWWKNGNIVSKHLPKFVWWCRGIRLWLFCIYPVFPCTGDVGQADFIKGEIGLGGLGQDGFSTKP